MKPGATSWTICVDPPGDRLVGFGHLGDLGLDVSRAAGPLFFGAVARGGPLPLPHGFLGRGALFVTEQLGFALRAAALGRCLRVGHGLSLRLS